MPDEDQKTPTNLANGTIMTATDEALRNRVENNERRALFAGAAVVAGVGIEVVLAFVANEPLSFRFAVAVADAIVVLGVGAELLFGKRASTAQAELQRRAEILLADATGKAGEAYERAAKADLARAELEAQLLPRTLTQKQFEALQSLRGRVSTVTITTPSDLEAIRFADEIARALTCANINVKIGNQRLGASWPNIYIALPKPSSNLQTEPLYQAFKSAGLSVGCGDRSQFPMADLPADLPVIMVGEKSPLKSPVAPFMAGLASPSPLQDVGKANDQMYALERAVAGRTLGAVDIAKLQLGLSTYQATVQIEYVRDNPECQNLAAHIREAFVRAGWKVELNARNYMGAATGLWVLPRAAPSEHMTQSLDTVRSSFAAIGLSFGISGGPAAVGTNGEAWGPNSPPVKVIVGAKPPPSFG